MTTVLWALLQTPSPLFLSDGGITPRLWRALQNGVVSPTDALKEKCIFLILERHWLECRSKLQQVKAGFVLAP